MCIRPIYSMGVLGMGLILAAAACNTVSGKEYGRVQHELIDTQSKVTQLQEKVAAKDQTIDMMKGQVAQVRGLKPENLEQLIVPVKIELERQSGGFNESGKPGDDGILLYVQPIDRNGDVIKAAGAIKVTLFDLANPPDQHVIGEYHFDVNKTRELWYGQMWTHHFTVRCPWQPGKPPRHDEITARVEFHDLLTGQTLTAQGVYKIKLPPHDATTGK